MRKATKTVAAIFGCVAGVAGLEHGIFEIMRGNVQPKSLMISSIGAPCIPEQAWNACEPAMTIVPNFLITGILAVIIGLAMLIWSLFFVHRKLGGLVLILFSVALLLFGGGLFPPLIGIIGGAAGTKINRPLTGKPTGTFLRFAAKLWPWPVVVFLVWIIGQWPVGYLFNALMQKAMYLGLILIFVTLPLSVYAAYAHDLHTDK